MFLDPYVSYRLFVVVVVVVVVVGVVVVVIVFVVCVRACVCMCTGQTQLNLGSLPTLAILVLCYALLHLCCKAMSAVHLPCYSSCVSVELGYLYKVAAQEISSMPWTVCMEGVFANGCGSASKGLFLKSSVFLVDVSVCSAG